MKRVKKAPVKRPRRMGAIASAIADALAAHGITHARWYKSKHGYVEFTHDGREIRFTFACTPKSQGWATARTLERLEKVLET